MSLNRLQLMVIAAWFAMIGVLLGTRLVFGIPTTLAESAAVVLLGCIPATVMLVVFRGAGPRNVTQMLYDIDRTSETVPVRVSDAGTGPARSSR